jgi:hypothetical protein
MSKQKLKLEVGKRYVLRNGGIVGPLHNYNHDFYPFKCQTSNLIWMRNGDFVYRGGHHPKDIVAEYVEPAAAAPQLTDEQVVARFNELAKQKRIVATDTAYSVVWYSNPKNPPTPDYFPTFALKPAEPRRLKLPDSGYECEISADGKEVKVGCKSFSIGDLCSWLTQLQKYGGFISRASGSLFATREGIRHDGPSSHTITWNDADQLLKFLTEEK